MTKILLVTSEKEPFSKFDRVLKQKDNVELSWASTGQEALEALSDNPVDLVIVNENIGDMTGIETASDKSDDQFCRRQLSITRRIS